jgi:hypothetical protein
MKVQLTITLEVYTDANRNVDDTHFIIYVAIFNNRLYVCYNDVQGTTHKDVYTTISFEVFVMSLVSQGLHVEVYATQGTLEVEF